MKAAVGAMVAGFEAAEVVEPGEVAGAAGMAMAGYKQ